MAETKYKPIRHDHKAFLRRAKRRDGFQEAYQALAVEYEVACEILASRIAHPKATSHASRKSVH